MRIAVLGRTHWLLDAANRLAQDGHDIVLVATAAPSGEYRVGPADFEALAQRCGALFWLEPDLNDADRVAAVRELGADVAISVNWPTLLRRPINLAFAKGILNSHLGDLPRYRGNACANWAILNGEPHVGACIHAMDPDAVDAGPVYVRRKMPLTQDTYIGDVYDWIDGEVEDMFSKAILLAADPSFTPEDQRRSTLRPLRTHPRRPEDGLIDWRDDADAIARLVRASSAPFSGAFTHLEGGVRVTIWRARVAQLDHDVLAVPGQLMGRGPSGGVLVSCGRGALELEDAQRADNLRLSAANRYRLFSP